MCRVLFSRSVCRTNYRVRSPDLRRSPFSIRANEHTLDACLATDRQPPALRHGDGQFRRSLPADRTVRESPGVAADDAVRRQSVSKRTRTSALTRGSPSRVCLVRYDVMSGRPRSAAQTSTPPWSPHLHSAGRGGRRWRPRAAPPASSCAAATTAGRFSPDLVVTDSGLPTGDRQNESCVVETDESQMRSVPDNGARSDTPTLNVSFLTEAGAKPRRDGSSDGSVVSERSRPRPATLTTPFHTMCHHTDCESKRSLSALRTRSRRLGYVRCNRVSDTRTPPPRIEVTGGRRRDRCFRGTTTPTSRGRSVRESGHAGRRSSMSGGTSDTLNL